jgi:transcriptional regulator with XRE-family HTH domain
MKDLRSNLREEFKDEEFRNVYADDSLNTHIATQIKVLREQQVMTQTELAEKTGMAQPRIAVLEDVNYSSWSINTLRRLARAFGLRLSVTFETFSSLIPELETFGRPVLERTKFEDDPFFQKSTPVNAQCEVIGAEVFLNRLQEFASTNNNFSSAAGQYKMGQGSWSMPPAASGAMCERGVIGGAR